MDNGAFHMLDTEELEAQAKELSVVQLLDNMVQHAYKMNASDIHIEPFEEKTMVRLRVDGVVIDFLTLDRSIHAPLITRVKIIGEMDIAERRLPQDGHVRMEVESQTLNMRISVIPTAFGEKAVLRLLASNTSIDYPETYGMTPENCEKLGDMLRSLNGLVYVTGPTGCGKSTTLYMILQGLAKRQVNISTIEDPIEKNIDRINQCQVNNLAGFTFESGLRSLLRQDPDIIMVGETRDKETASVSVRAAITGHLVLSTLHTNDAPSAIIRLKDMGVESYLVANALIGVVAQRLMRKLCPDCAREVEADAQVQFYLEEKVAGIKEAVGCSACSHTGYRGRIAIHEILVVDKTMREMIASGTSVDDMKAYAKGFQGMTTLKQAGAALVREGITTMEELYKVAYYES